MGERTERRRKMITTDKSQSARLLACGVPADTADMFYTNYPNKPNDNKPYIGMVGIRKDLIPAWSLSALLTKVLPRTIQHETIGVLEFDLMPFSSNEWIAGYCCNYARIFYATASDPIEACVLMAEKLVANGYKLNENK